METVQSRHVEGSAPGNLLHIITGLFAAVLVLSSVTSVKLFMLGPFFGIGPFFVPGGVVLFPIVFIFNDILTEVYGYAKSRQVIWTGLFCQVLAAAAFTIVGALPPAPFWQGQAAYNEILGFVPRVAMSGLLSYFCGEFANSIVLSKMKYQQNGERGFKQGWRFVASTMVGEAVDSVVFVVAAFAGTMGNGQLVITIATLYVIKVIYEIVALPLSTRVANYIKRKEGVDKIDTPETNYSPFAVS